jgi:hypothetical protein
MPESGHIRFSFEHVVDNEPLLFDTLLYLNEAGNSYMVNEIQYFISEITLHAADDKTQSIDDWKIMHYVDTDLSNTRTWEVFDPIPPGKYDSISFVFGISEHHNLSFMFVNPPEKDMFWPEYLGGGYHYMKLNGKWLPEGQTFQTAPFDFHLGIGQEYFSYPDSITGFIHNNFRVFLPESSFTIKQGETLEFTLTMHVDRWFKDPHIYNHDVYGGYIMQSQEAMQKVKENGHNVFTIQQL